MRWKAPAAGTYQVSGLFEGIEQGAGGTTSDATIVLNASTNPQPVLFHTGDASPINYVNGFGTKVTFSFSITLAASDTLDFRVGWGSNNAYNYDATGLAASVVLVPPPLQPSITNVDFPFTGGQLAISGGTGPYTVTVSSGSLPAGISISSSGLVTGTAVNGAYSFTLHVVDSLGAFSDRMFSGTLENPVPVPPSIIAWWSGENAVGEIISGNHGSLQNGAIYGAGKVGRAFSFDGINDFIQVPDGPGMNLAGDFTIEGWLYHTANSPIGETIISKRSGDNNNVPYVVFLESDGRLAFSSRNGGAPFAPVFSTTPVTTNAWAHIAVTLTGGQVSFYVNGALLNTVPYTATRPTVTEPLTIGATITDAFPASSPTGPLPGLIDELSLYSRALGAGEIASIAGAGKGGKVRYDVARDFSGTANPNGAWSYRSLPASASMSTYDPTLADTRLLSGTGTPDSNGILAWVGSSGVSFNPTDNFVAIQSGGSQYDWLPHGFGMGPGAGSEFAVARWTAPQSGTYAVSGTFQGADTHIPTNVDVHIFHNATQLTPADKRAVTSYRGDGVSHTQIITVSTGDKVDFVLGPGDNGYNYDSSALAASVVLLLAQTQTPGIVVEQPANTGLTDGASTVNFGSSSVSVPVSLTFTIKNAGPTDLTGLAITIDGPNGGDFLQGNLVPPTSTIAPGASKTLAVTFTPTAAGYRSGALHIASSDPNHSSFDIALTGFGNSASATGNAIFGWGDGEYSTIGDGTTTNRLSPVPTIMTGVLAGKTVISVVAGQTQSFALTSDGTLYAWGQNIFSGELGDGTRMRRNAPVAVDMTGALSGKIVTAVAAGADSSYALTSDGKLYAWGSNFSGELGLGGASGGSHIARLAGTGARPAGLKNRDGHLPRGPAVHGADLGWAGLYLGPQRQLPFVGRRHDHESVDPRALGDQRHLARRKVDLVDRLCRLSQPGAHHRRTAVRMGIQRQWRTG